MERQINIIDESGQEHLLKYLDENRVIVHKVTRYDNGPDEEDVTRYSMPAKVRLEELHKWPFTEGLKKKIVSWHKEFPDAE